jgi:hypothetical protein
MQQTVKFMGFRDFFSSCRSTTDVVPFAGPPAGSTPSTARDTRTPSLHDPLTYTTSYRTSSRTATPRHNGTHTHTGLREFSTSEPSKQYPRLSPLQNGTHAHRGSHEFSTREPLHIPSPRTLLDKQKRNHRLPPLAPARTADDTCGRGFLKQVGGTCWFNAAWNVLLLSHPLRSLLVTASKTHPTFELFEVFRLLQDGTGNVVNAIDAWITLRGHTTDLSGATTLIVALDGMLPGQVKCASLSSRQGGMNSLEDVISDATENVVVIDASPMRIQPGIQPGVTIPKQSGEYILAGALVRYDPDAEDDMLVSEAQSQTHVFACFTCAGEGGTPRFAVYDSNNDDVQQVDWTRPSTMVGDLGLKGQVTFTAVVYVKKNISAGGGSRRSKPRNMTAAPARAPLTAVLTSDGPRRRPPAAVPKAKRPQRPLVAVPKAKRPQLPPAAVPKAKPPQPQPARQGDEAVRRKRALSPIQRQRQAV